MSLQDLRDAGCPEDVVAAVDALTKRPGESLEESLARVVTNPIARMVKLADIADNTDRERTALLPPGVRARLAEKYRQSLLELGSGPHPQSQCPTAEAAQDSPWRGVESPIADDRAIKKDEV